MLAIQQRSRPPYGVQVGLSPPGARITVCSEPGSPVQTSKAHSTLVLKTKTRDLKMSTLSFHSSFTEDPGAKMSPYTLSKSPAKGAPNSQVASMMVAILAKQNQVEQGSTLSARQTQQEEFSALRLKKGPRSHLGLLLWPSRRLWPPVE